MVDQRVTTRPEHTPELRVRARQIGDMDQDVTAPDQVRRARADRDVLGRADLEERPVLAGGGPRHLDMPAHRVDAGDHEAEPPVQGHGLPALAASHVEGYGTRCQAEAGDEIVEQVRAARVQALVEGSREFLLDLRVGLIGLLKGPRHRSSSSRWDTGKVVIRVAIGEELRWPRSRCGVPG